MWKIDIQRLDYDDYPIGMPLVTIGPFDSHEEAYAFLHEAHPYTPNGSRRDLPNGYSAVVGSIRMTPPNDYKRGLSV